MATKNRRCVLEQVDDDLKFVIREAEIPETPSSGVVVKVQHAGICHSDVHMSEKNFADMSFPIVFGHEISGTVHSIGADVAKGGPDFAVGDRVIVYPWGGCNNCSTCKSDNPFCINGVNPKFDKTALYTYGVRKDGGFQNYVVVHDGSFVIKVPDGLSMEVAALVPCSGITAFNASSTLKESIERGIKINGSARVGVFGAGGLALWAIQILRAMYPENLTIVAVDVVDEKLEDAKKQGADLTFKWGITGELPQIIGGFLGVTGGLLDGALDFTGLPSVQTRIFALLAGGATMSCIGIGNKSLPDMKLLGLVLRQISLKGVYVGSRAMCRELFGLILDGKVKPPPITPVGLEDVSDSIVKMRNNQIRGRHVVKMASSL